jgi:hypothetical protein
MKDDEFWDKDAIIKDRIFDSNVSYPEIADELGITIAELNRRIKALGLDWVASRGRKVSRGQAALTKIVRQLIPKAEIINEYQVGEKLRLDIYLPQYKLGIEYHGRQHFFYSNLFFKDRQDFLDAQKRDERKIELCKEQGIALVVFRFTDKLTQEAVFERIVGALNSTPYVKEKRESRYKGNAYYEKRKESDREYRKKRYRELKRKRRDG